MLVNGLAIEQISPRDRGLAYGDGVFRTLKCEDGRLLAWPRHYRKLQADCAALGLVCPDESVWLADLARLAPVTAAIKLTVTRGVSARGYVCDPDAPSTRIVQMGPLPPYGDALYQNGAVVRLCDWRLPLQPGLAGIKHLNRLDQVMARREWQDTATFDGLMLNARDEVVEGVMSNLYLVQGDCLLTHPLHDCGVAGVTRELVLEAAVEAGLRQELTPFDTAALLAADAVVLSNSLVGVVPVARCGDRRWQDLRLAQQLHTLVRSISRSESLPCVIA